MVVIDVESKFEGKIRDAGLSPYFADDQSQFLDLEGNYFVELVTRDSTKLGDFQRIAADVKSELAAPLKIVVRAEWEIERVGDPLPAYSPKTGTPRMAVVYPVFLKSGTGTQEVWVEVTTLASMVLKDHGFTEDGIKQVVRDFVTEQLRRGGASYWDPISSKQLEISADMAEYIASTRSSKK
jgi:hypothetical protein